MDLGTERNSPAQIRMYLTRIGTDFHDLVKAGVEGIYGSQDKFFHEINDEKECHRLRATIHMENGNFANYMREHGQKRKLVSAEHQHEEEIYPETGQIFVTREQMSTWIKNVGLLHFQNSHKLTPADIRPHPWPRTSWKS